MALADAGDVAVLRSRRHVDIADDVIADTAVEVAFLSDDVVIDLNRLGHDADIVQADIAFRRHVDVDDAREAAFHDELLDQVPDEVRPRRYRNRGRRCPGCSRR